MSSRVDASVVPRLPLSALSAVLLALVACQRPDSSLPSSPEGIASAQDGSAGLRFQAKLAPTTPGQGHGVLQLEIADGQLTVKVRANGLEPRDTIPQHIHQSSTCGVVGDPILLNLDAGLTVAGEGPGVGPDYPTANAGGVIQYDASRSLADLIDAVNEFQSAGVSTVEQLLEWLDLEDRNMHTHQPVSPFTPVACGPIDRIR